MSYGVNLQGATRDNVFPSHVDLVFENTPEITLPTIKAVLLKKRSSTQKNIDTGISVYDTQSSKKTPMKISYSLDGKDIGYYFSSEDSYNSMSPIQLIKNQEDQTLVSTGVAITGLKNKDDSKTTTSKGSKASVMIGENLTRYDLLTTFKKNATLNSNGLKWCKGPLTITDLNSDFVGCTVTVKGEKISFIEGSVTLGNGGTLMLNDSMKRSIIVKNGFTYIKSNISTYNKSKAQFLIGTYNDVALKTLALPSDLNVDIASNNDFVGWTFVSPLVTNLDAYIVSQGPIVSYDEKMYVRFENTPAPELKYQLHIYGSLLSLNTNGASENLGITYACPYVVTNCTSQNNFASIFDLVFLRHNNQLKIPANPNLRPVSDPDYKVFPLFIERNPSWNTSPSVLFQGN